ncbi:MAG: hypothetical protein WC329_08620 [Candidatus Omnitrophota bacterium]|jgi:hypothetical protein
MPSIGFDPCPVYGRATFDKCDTCPSRCHPLPVLKAMMGNREVVPGKYSTTEILRPLQAMYLSRHNDFFIDPEKTIFMINGTAVHSIIEQGGAGLGNCIIEKPFEVEIAPGVFLTGKPDLYESDTSTLWDVKNSKAYTVKKHLKAVADKLPWLAEDYFMQVNIYHKYCFPEAKKLKLYFIVQGWTRREEMKPIEQVSVPVATIAEVNLWVKNRLQKIVDIESTGKPPECLTGDLWIRADGTPMRCAEYCNAKEFCPQAKRLMEKIKGGAK